MKKIVRVYVSKWKEVLYDGICVGAERDGRMVVEAELLEDRATAIRVRLPDGRVIMRKKKRDLVPDEKEVQPCQLS